MHFSKVLTASLLASASANAALNKRQTTTTPPAPTASASVTDMPMPTMTPTTGGAMTSTSADDSSATPDLTDSMVAMPSTLPDPTTLPLAKKSGAEAIAVSLGVAGLAGMVMLL
ncbi:hypothetical protein BCR37DRAFT_388740 [Protomyces lactucae-debilis]|uniref:Uncharacterized protein n=1 Tax=Protomyces lactucae-debilis TaxID=2754530 RepID=A0A1Y2F5C1_PROLT|nr:uncharacterized protein BCR37DRAFT_388740 [Protomyces lactucae-debilis]ORY78546.1 hypothetical protein BCR37DRAFT_388740 [Protomyces lactucae-debilis]